MLRYFYAILLTGFVSDQAVAQFPATRKDSPLYLPDTLLYVPRDVQLAYKNGTRSPDGRPGRRYWQNSGRYEISIDAAPPDRTIRGSEKITYFNNSPDTLRVIVFR
ncbi:MAG TPA: hypothetical protein VG101_10940, partial [Puia sp.]|nr:hypothetical protein [Puia sp.]